MPHVLTVSHAQKNLIDEKTELLCSLGFGIEPFGSREYKIDAVPAAAANTNVEEIFFDALEETAKSGSDIVLLRERVIRAACRHAVKAGDKLSRDALTGLVQSFLETGVMPTCPHGRPVITVITKKQLEKSFKRVI
jgi:DNA mismatch repair protein MutL